MTSLLALLGLLAVSARADGIFGGSRIKELEDDPWTHPVLSADRLEAISAFRTLVDSDGSRAFMQQRLDQGGGEGDGGLHIQRAEQKWHHADSTPRPPPLAVVKWTIPDIMGRGERALLASRNFVVGGIVWYLAFELQVDPHMAALGSDGLALHLCPALAVEWGELDHVSVDFRITLPAANKRLRSPLAQQYSHLLTTANRSTGHHVLGRSDLDWGLAGRDLVLEVTFDAVHAYFKVVHGLESLYHRAIHEQASLHIPAREFGLEAALRNSVSYSVVVTEEGTLATVFVWEGGLLRSTASLKILKVLMLNQLMCHGLTAAEAQDKSEALVDMFLMRRSHPTRGRARAAAVHGTDGGVGISARNLTGSDGHTYIDTDDGSDLVALTLPCRPPQGGQPTFLPRGSDDTSLKGFAAWGVMESDTAAVAATDGPAEQPSGPGSRPARAGKPDRAAAAGGGGRTGGRSAARRRREQQRRDAGPSDAATAPLPHHVSAPLQDQPASQPRVGCSTSVELLMACLVVAACGGLRLIAPRWQQTLLQWRRKQVRTAARALAPASPVLAAAQCGNSGSAVGAVPQPSGQQPGARGARLGVRLQRQQAAPAPPAQHPQQRRAPAAQPAAPASARPSGSASQPAREVLAGPPSIPAAVPASMPFTTAPPQPSSPCTSPPRSHCPQQLLRSSSQLLLPSAASVSSAGGDVSIGSGIGSSSSSSRSSSSSALTGAVRGARPAMSEAAADWAQLYFEPAAAGETSVPATPQQRQRLRKQRQGGNAQAPTSGELFQDAPATPTPAAPAAAARRAASPDDGALCLVCLDAPREHGFLHGSSMHIGVCGVCAAAMQRQVVAAPGRRAPGLSCPVCREPVERLVALFA